MLYQIRQLITIPKAILLALITNLPGEIGRRLRYRYWKKRLRYLGRDVLIDVGVYFQRPEYISIGDNSWLDRHVIILAGPSKANRAKKEISNLSFQYEVGEVVIGSQVHIAPNVILSGIGGLSIGDACGIGANSKLYSLSHHYDALDGTKDKMIYFSPMVPADHQYLIEGSISIANNVGLGANCFILPGTALAENSFVKLGSVVRGDFTPNSLIAGNPARRVGDRYPWKIDDLSETE